MIRIRSIAGFAAAAALALATPVFAQSSMSTPMRGDSMSGSMIKAACPPPPRFGGSNYCNNPKLTNTLALVMAGGGPSHFSTVTLFGVLAGDKAAAEKAKLIKQFGEENFTQYVKTFDFVIADSLKIAAEKKIALPSAPAPDPKDGKALAAALYMDGVDPKNGFSVEYMLDHLVSHPIHVQVMKDIDTKYGLKADGDYHVVTLQIFKDLKSVYGL